MSSMVVVLNLKYYNYCCIMQSMKIQRRITSEIIIVPWIFFLISFESVMFSEVLLSADSRVTKRRGSAGRYTTSDREDSGWLWLSRGGTAN